MSLAHRRDADAKSMDESKTRLLLTFCCPGSYRNPMQVGADLLSCAIAVAAPRPAFNPSAVTGQVDFIGWLCDFIASIGTPGVRRAVNPLWRTAAC